MMLGDLSKEDLEGGIRDGAIGDPSVGQIRVLAGVFGVEPSYLLDRGEPVFDGKLITRCPMGPSGKRPLRSRGSQSEREATGVGDRAAVRNAGRCYRSSGVRGSRLIGALLHAGPTQTTRPSFES
jgi:hypothetical protein